MGLSTYIVIEKDSIKDVNKLLELIVDTVEKWQRNELDNYLNIKGFDNRLSFMYRDKNNQLNSGLKDFSNGISKITSTKTFDYFIAHFITYNESYALNLHTNINDMDYLFKGSKICINMNKYGISNEVMELLLKTLDCKMYYINDDSNNTHDIYLHNELIKTVNHG